MLSILSGLKFWLTLSQTSPCFYMSELQILKSTVGNGKIAHKEQFLLLPQCFYPSVELSAIFIKLKIVVGKLFHFGRV